MSALYSRVIGSAATALLAFALLATTAVPSSAKPDPGPMLERTSTSTSCSLQRVGTQFVRCDDLTGNGVPAPEWVPQR